MLLNLDDYHERIWNGKMNSNHSYTNPFNKLTLSVMGVRGRATFNPFKSIETGNTFEKFGADTRKVSPQQCAECKLFFKKMLPLKN